MTLIFVDCEAFGPCPIIGYLTEFGAVEYKTQTSFYGILYEKGESFEYRGEMISIRLDEDLKTLFLNFEQWLKQFKGRPIFVSDNPAFDWQWINYEFHRLLGRNPFGHSARRISDFYAGLNKDFSMSQGWKKWRKTPHDHNPVHDALGNVEAFKRMVEEYNLSKTLIE